jgi:hypothetical protein
MASPWEEIPGFIDVHHIEGGSIGEVSLYQARARLKYLIEWDAQWEACRAILGREETVIDPNSGNSIIVVKPKQHPHNPVLYASRATIMDPLGAVRLPEDESKEIAYDWVSIEVEYESAVWSDDTPRRIISMVGGEETVQFGEFAWQFASGQRFPAPLGATVNFIDYTIELPRAPRIPPGIFAAVGRVNSVVFEGFPVGTLKLGAVQARETIGADGSQLYSLTYPFRYREVPHNHEMNPYTGAFEEVSHPTSGRRKFLTSTFSDIFI